MSRFTNALEDLKKVLMLTVGDEFGLEIHLDLKTKRQLTDQFLREDCKYMGTKPEISQFLGVKIVGRDDL